MRFRARCSALFSSCRPLPRPGLELPGPSRRYPVGPGWPVSQALGTLAAAATAQPHRQPLPAAAGAAAALPDQLAAHRTSPARVLSVRGKVELSGADGSATRALLAGEQLRIGDTVQTEGDSSVTLEFADASRLQLREHSRLRTDQLSRYGHTGMVDTRVRLQQGRASNRVTPARGPASRYIIDAPTATSSVRGTVFRVSAGDAGHVAATEVLQGKVQVGNIHGKRRSSRTGQPQQQRRYGAGCCLRPSSSTAAAQRRHAHGALAGPPRLGPRRRRRPLPR